jgi:GalNAc-alpha-(1->4)-GalNAc-alpha-(1->3)-diNAcBac-PP-undecaprenol alpha-1,4-N-acetyl-D-galactosaminyltransferase
MRLTMIISSLSSGGAERVASVMANHWAKKGWPITLLTFDDGETPFYPLDSRISHRSLALARVSSNPLEAARNNLRRIRRLRSAIRQSRPDCVLSFMDQMNVLTLLAAEGLRVPVIVIEQNYPPEHKLSRTWNRLRDWTYPRAFRVVGVTARVLSHFSPRIQSRSAVIHNPVLRPPAIPAGPAEKLLDRPALLSIGRLHEQKGHDLLLRAFARLKDRHANWSLTILGEGPRRQELETLSHRLGISERVKLPGRTPDPDQFLRQADLFVMASRFEGFPMALGEAMARGLPVIATDCPSGPAEMIRDGVDGVLVPNGDVEALAAAMNRLMSDEPLRLQLSRRAPEAAERFGLEGIMRTWEELLARSTGRSKVD